MKKSGFTLLETIIYCALFSVLMTSVLVTVYTLMESNDRMLRSLDTTVEAMFITEKLSWIFFNATNISVINPSTVRIDRPDVGTSSPFLLEAQGTTLTLKRGSADAGVLTDPVGGLTNVVLSQTTSSLRISYDINGQTFDFETSQP